MCYGGLCGFLVFSCANLWGEVQARSALQLSGRSAAWLARLVRDQEVEGSNPFAPTTFYFSKHNKLNNLAACNSIQVLSEAIPCKPLAKENPEASSIQPRRRDV